MHSNPALVLDLAGPLRLTDGGGTDLTPRGRKAQGLLALLGTSPRLKRSRSWLQDKLWSDRGPEQGASSLRQCLSEIRSCLGPHVACLRNENGWVSLDPDVIVVRTTLPDGAGPGSEVEFLEGLCIPDPEFEDWLRDQRIARSEAIAPEPARGYLAPRPSSGGSGLARPPTGAATHAGAIATGPSTFAITPSGRPSVAVLGMSETRELASAYSLSGFIEDLTNELVHQRGFRVVARPLCGSLDGTIDPRDAAGSLGATYLVLCRLTHHAGQVQLVIQLVEGASADVRWSERSLLTSTGPEALPARSAAIAALLAGFEGEIVRCERERLQHNALASNDPFELYVLAGANLDIDDRASALAALALAERCTQLDPHFAPGWLMLNWRRCHLFSHGWGDLSGDRLSRESAVFRRAVELEPRDPVSLSYLAVSRAKFGANGEAGRLIERAAELAVRQPGAVMELALPMSTIAGQPARALAMMDRALDRHPSPRAQWGFMECRAAFLAGRHERAMAASDGVPDCLPRYLFRALAAVELGDHAEALACWAGLRTLVPGFDFEHYARNLPIVHPAALAAYRSAAARVKSLASVQ